MFDFVNCKPTPGHQQHQEAHNSGQIPFHSMNDHGKARDGLNCSDPFPFDSSNFRGQIAVRLIFLNIDGVLCGVAHVGADYLPILQPYRYIIGVVPVRKDQEQDHAEEIKRCFPERTRIRRGFGQMHCRNSLPVCLPESKGHEETDDYCKYHCTDSTADPEVQTQNAGRKKNGHDVDGRTGIQKRTCGTEPGTHGVDSCKHGQNAAGADSQDGT